MAQDTTPAIVMHQGDGSNRLFSVPFDKGNYGEIKVAFVRRGLTEYEFNPTTYTVDGYLYAWELRDDSKQYRYTKTNDNKVYDSNNAIVGGVTVDSMFDSSIKFSDGKTGYRAYAKDIISHSLVEWLGDPLMTNDWICIVRDTQMNQPYTYPNNQKHIEGALDNLSRQIQELKAQSNISLKVDPTFEQDPAKMNPIDWLDTIVRSTDTTARGLRYRSHWLEYSTDDPNKAEEDKTWTRLLNTTNITSVREWYDEEKKVYIPQYSMDGGATWKQLGATHLIEDVQQQIDEIKENTYTKTEIDNKVTVINAEIDANADAIQKTREDYINADSEIHQILNNHADELTTLRGNQASLGDQVSGIEEKIPGSASATNPLATKQDLANVKVDLTGYATETYVNTREQKIRDDVNAEDSRLQSQITAQASAITANTTSINGVKAVIPQGTSATNPLINKQQLLDEEMDIRDDLNESISELQTQITAQAAAIEEKQDKLTAGDNIIISGNVISATGAGGGTGFDAIVVQELPATGQKGVIYLVSKGGQAPDIYNEYVWITATKTFELIGSTQVDLTNYATKNELNAKQDKLTAAGTSSLPVYYDGTRLKETTRLRAEMVSGGLDGEIYYAHHPEMNNMHIIPFIYNDFAFIDKKGGSYTVTRSDNGEIARPEFIFDAAPSYMLSRGFSSDTVWTVEISTPTNFTYSTLLYVDFGTSGFACKYIKVEAQHSVTGEWKTVLEKTDNVLSYVYCKCASDDVGVNKFRFTFKNPLSTIQFRISSIGAISFKSSGIEETVLTLKGGTVFGDVIAPNITNIQNALGGKVNIAQGAENAGKILKVDDSGNVVVGEGGGASLPDQTGNAGKFLTTDGTVASWGGNDIIRNKAKESYFNSTVAIGTPIASYTSACISITGSDGDAASGAVVLGSKAKAKAVNSIVIGRYATNTSDAKGSITLNAATKSSTASNTEPNTFKIGNDNGLFTMMSDDGKIPLERLTKVTDQIAESVNTKDLTVGTDEGTLNLSITAGVATIATNNGLDIVAQTKFDTAPTTDDTTTWADALDTSFIRKAQAATALSGKVDITQGAENANKILKANRVGVLEPSYAENLAVRYGRYLWVGDNTGASYFTSKEIPTVGESLGGSYTVGAVSNNSINVYKGGSSYETATRNSSGDVIEYGTESLSDKADKSLSNIDYSGKTAIANISMPSERRIDLVLGSNGSEYTAPADGYYVVGKVNGTTAQRFIQLKNITTQVISRSFAPYESNNTFVFVPCRKGDVVTANYDMTGETTYFYFVYAEGTKHLA